MLKPSRRDKKRYVVVKILGEEIIDKEELISAVWKESYNYGGYVFTALSNLNVIKDINTPENVFIIAINPKYVEDLRFILLNLRNINNKKVIAYVKGVGGTLNSVKTKYLEGDEN